MKINCETAKGGAVELNKKHGVWASYAVATVGDTPAPEIMYAGITLPSGKSIQFFVNRETGLVVLDVVNKGGKSGVELIRRKVE
jgi:hypothetical protein